MEGTDRLGDAGLWRGVVDASPDAVLLVDEDGLIVSANSHCLEVFGTHPDELVGRAVEALVPVAVRQHHPRRRASFEGVHGGRPMGLLQLAAARADGSEFPAEISLAKVSTE
ncbi:MAG: PAS domain-containing protein, partial [Actinomycetota bacterium]|nr:PAS domain-containing protein [Actinomycetota bacterium]